MSDAEGQNFDTRGDAVVSTDDAYEHRGLKYPFGRFAPAFGTVHDIAPGIGWTRLPVPGSLKHINVWLLDDGDGDGDEEENGVAIVDTGVFTEDSRNGWEAALGGTRVTRVIGTHFHPDHIGCAGWLCDRYDARLWMSRTEWFTARLALADVRDDLPMEAIAQLTGAGWTAAQLDRRRAEGWGQFARYVSPMPMGHVRMQEGETVRTGKHDWTLWVGSGHAPEHVCLIDEIGGVMIAGDQVLPRISSNISVSLSEPLGDPLGDWLASIDKFRALPDDLLVLPAHGEPFYGLHARLDSLEEGHRRSLDALYAFVHEAPRRAVDCFGVLFRRPIDDGLLGLATGEALAHLRHLETTGRARREVRDDVWFFSAA